MGTVDVAPRVPVGQGVMTHVVVGVEINVRDVIGRITDEDVVAVLNNIEIGAVRRVVMGMRPGDVAPVSITVDVVHRVGTFVMIKGVRIAGADGVGGCSKAPGKSDSAE